MLNIFDCNNHIRRQYEVDKTGLVLRNLYTQALHSSPGSMIFVFDGRNAKATRRSLYSGYKAKRPAAPDEFYRVLDTSKKVLRHAPQLLVEIEGLEADDVIASIVNSLPGQEITIHSNDGDFQTLCGEKVKMSNPTLTAVDPKEVRLYKTLVGDGSDNIPGFKGFGPKSWEQLDSVQKDNWINLLNGGVLQEEPELFGLVIKQMPRLVMDLPELRSYWRIINFVPVSDDLIERGTIVGIPNPSAANKLLVEVMQ